MKFLVSALCSLALTLAAFVVAASSSAGKQMDLKIPSKAVGIEKSR